MGGVALVSHHIILIYLDYHSAANMLKGGCTRFEVSHIHFQLQKKHY